MSLALVDCNNFFASCERVFNPKLEGKPIVVLSSNDGCVVARSQEAKQLGIPMGAPAFQCEALFKKYGVYVFSSNFALYLDMSHRVMLALSRFTQQLEIYSVDEAFLSFDAICPEERVAYAHTIRNSVLAWTGILVSIGISSTKTLTKVANHFAKKEGGVCLIDETNRKALLETVPVKEIWGIGAKLTERLHKKGIYTAWQLQSLDDSFLKKEFTVVILRLVWELRGIQCHEVQEQASAKKSISTAKSFEHPVNNFEEMSALLAGYTAEVAADLRKQDSLASFITVFLPDIQEEGHLVFPEPTNYTPRLMSYAKKIVAKIYKEGVAYKKVGVLLGGFVAKGAKPQDLFSKGTKNGAKEEKLMELFDQVNDRYGKNSLTYAAIKERKRRATKQTPRYTTRWDELPIAYAS